MVHLILALLQSGSQASLASWEPARAVVAHATSAVNGDSAVRVRRRWAAVAARDRVAVLGLSTLARLTYDYTEAARRYSALLGGREVRDTLELYAQLERALTLTQQWQAGTAVEALQRTIAAARRLAQPRVEAEALMVLARFAARSAGLDSAAALLRRAGQLAPAQDAPLLATHRCATAGLLRYSSPTRADSLVGEALATARSSGDARVLARCHQVRAAILEVRGLQQQAAQAADSAARIAASVHDLEALAAAQQFRAYLGVQYSATFDRARSVADSAIANGRKSGSLLAVAWAELNLAQLAMRLSDARSALQHLDRAKAAMRQLNDWTGLAAALLLEGDAANAVGQLDRARVRYDSANALYAGLRFDAARPTVLWRLSGLELEAGNQAAAELRFTEGLALAQRLNLIGHVDVNQFYVRGMLALRRGDAERAAREFETFLGRVSSGIVHYRFDGRMRLTEAYARAGRLDDAIRTLEQGFLDLDSARAMLNDRDARVAVLQSRFFEFDADLGIATIVNLLAENGRVDTAFRVMEAQRARHLWEQMVRRGALAGATQSEARAVRLVAEPIGSAELRSRLPDSTAVLEYITGRGGEPTTLFLVQRSGVRSWTLAPADTMLQEIERFARALESGVRATQLGRRLAALVLDSALEALPANVSRLVILPHGPLHRLPVDALVLRDGRTVLERYAVSIAPSSRLVHAFWNSPSSNRAQRLLALGGARFATTSELAALPASEREVRTIARFATQADVRTGERASEATLKSANLSDVGILHLATHAQVEDWGILSSALYLSPGGGEDGRMGVEEIAGLTINADLVVLSACRTVGGTVVNGEGIQGLTTSFLEAGARAVVATYWPVRDRSIVPLISSFYQSLGLGLSAGDALRQAKLRSLRAGESPSHWASLTLTGDAGVRPRQVIRTNRR